MLPTTIGAVTRIILSGGGSPEKLEQYVKRFWRSFYRKVSYFLSPLPGLRTTMRSSTKRSRKKTKREAVREKRQRDPVSDGEVEESEIVFRATESPTDPPSSVPRSPPGSPSVSADLPYEDVLDMVQRLNKELGLINLDNDKIRSVCNQLLRDNQARNRSISDLTGLVERSLDRPAVQ